MYTPKPTRIMALPLLALLLAAGTASAAPPRLTANSLTLLRGDTVPLSVAHVDATDTDSPTSALVYTASSVTGGRFERASAPGAAITTFTATELGTGAIQFVHNNSNVAPAWNLSVSDGQSGSAPLPASVTFALQAPASGMEAPAAALALVQHGNATHTAAASGLWSDTSTWGGSLPGAGAHIVIPAGVAVVVDSVFTPEYETLRVDGMLRFAIDRNTGMEVDTIVSTGGSRFEIGTPSIPVDPSVTATVTFADDGNINTNTDFAQISRGAILRGHTVIYGDETTSHVALASHPTSGATQLQLASTPTGWDVGDELVITGTTPNDHSSDEIRTIAAISGTTVTLSTALNRDHTAPRPDLNVYVANTTRNIVFDSENQNFRRRGHVMFAQTNLVDVNYARFYRLGRTDKTRALDDWDFEWHDDTNAGNQGSAPIHFDPVEGNRTNIRGRYPIHIHRNGTDPNSDPAVVRGCVVWDGPGWGFVTHSSHTDFINNISYAVQGTGFYTEAGDEVGSMIGNIAIRSVNSAFQYDSPQGAIDPDLGFDNQEFGNDGDGYWLSGLRVAMIDNVSAGSTAHGFIYWVDGLVEADTTPMGRRTVKTSEIPNGHLIPGRTEIPVWWAQMAEFRGNEAYGSSVGFRARYIHSQAYLGEGGSPFHAPPPQEYIDTLDPVIEDMQIWGNRDGVLLNYNARMSVKDSLIVGIGAGWYLDSGTMNTGPGIDLGTEVTNGSGRLENLTIEGFEMGIVAPKHDQWVFENLTLANKTDMLITETRQGPRTISMSNITFASLVGTAVSDHAAQRQNIVMTADFDAAGWQPYWFVMPDRITLDGQGIYFDEQATNFKPLPSSPDNSEMLFPVPNSYVNKTNQQLFDNHGVSFGGAFLPNNAQQVSWVSGGRVGSLSPAATTFPTLYDMSGEGHTPEPFPGGPTPELTGNRLKIRRGQTLVLMETNLNTTDTNTPIANLVYTVANVTAGFFAHRDAPATPITSFNQAQVDGGVIRFVHNGSCNAPSYDARVTDGNTATAFEAGVVFFDAGNGCGGPGTTTTTTLPATTTTTTTTTLPGPTTTTTTVTTSTTSTTTTTLAPGDCGNGVLDNGEDCDDGNTVSGDCCSATCAFEPAGSTCDDGDVCTTPDRCNGAGTCTSSAAVCDDGNPCTVETCDPVAGCPVAGVPTPQLEGACLFPMEVSLQIIDKFDDRKDKMQFKWRSGEEADPDLVGDFNTDTSLHFCVFDQSGGNAELVLHAMVPAGDDWAPRPNPASSERPIQQWRYKDKGRDHDGIEQVKMRLGPEDRAQIQIKAKGERLPLPAPFSADEFFAVDPEMQVEVHSSSGVCWMDLIDDWRVNRGSDYSTPAFKW